ncbi:aminotransferase class V-fold PLP-dependent enzyme [Plantactinospora sp. GCM10030261]|uniref:aminotransferase class V-fold PLP-dependent enzyme n=1 Tax=Plantactinospora sp. GCM10030261 TaxID=3273420 RepID=UPI00360F887D
MKTPAAPPAAGRSEPPPDPIPGARLLFSLDPAVTHLDHGSYGATPVTVQRAQQRLRDETEANPTRFFTRGLVDRVAHTRRHLAGFLGTDQDGASLVGTVAAGVTLVLRSLRLAAGDEVVDTDHGHRTVRLAIDRECERTGAVRRTVPVPLTPSDGEVLSALRTVLRPGRTRLLIVDQLTSTTVRLLPVAAVTAMARELDVPVLVDATHAPGMLTTPVAEIGADFWIGDLHPWAYAPRGTALLAVTPRWRSRIEPLPASWGWSADPSIEEECQSTTDQVPWLAAPAGLFVLRTLGLDAIRSHNAALVAYGQRVIGDALDVAPADLPDPGGTGVAMRLVPLPSGVAATPAGATTVRRRISAELSTEVSVTHWGGRGWLRLSAQIYNRPEEYDRLADALPGLLATLR